MILSALLAERNISKYRLAKLCNVSTSTISELCSGVLRMEKCTAETIYKISKALDVPMERLLAPYCESRPDFEIFKSNVCHKLKMLGDTAFLMTVLQEDDITKFYEWEWYPECFYLLAMLDYLSRLHNIPLCDKYTQFRQYKLPSILYPADVKILCKLYNNEHTKEEVLKHCIPEFIRHNIVECEVYDAV